jgi:hypothetical protein
LLPVFDHDLGLVPNLSAGDFDARLVELIQSDAESETLQYVFRAIPINRDEQIDLLSRRYAQTRSEIKTLQDRISRLKQEAKAQRSEREQERLRQEEQLALSRSNAERQIGDLRNAVATNHVELKKINDQLQDAASSNAARGKHLEEAEKALALERALHKAERDAREAERAVHASERVELAAVREKLVATEERSTLRAQYLEEAERLLSVERAAFADLQVRLDQQTDTLIAATRAESDKISHLINIVQSSFFWKLKRALNRLLRLIGLRE